MAGRMAVTPGNTEIYTYLRINLHMLNECHIVLFFPFLLVQVKDFNIPVLKLNWDSTQKIKLYSCYDATGISDYITMYYIWKGA